jgi:hypothetical protein
MAKLTIYRFSPNGRHTRVLRSEWMRSQLAVVYFPRLNTTMSGWKGSGRYGSESAKQYLRCFPAIWTQ